MNRRFHEKVSGTLRSIIDSLLMTRHSGAMFQRAIISKLIRTLFSVALLAALALYPPSSAHAHASAHGTAAIEEADIGHHSGESAHAHHDKGDLQLHLSEADSGKSSDTPNCCQGICMAAVIAQSPSDMPNIVRADHEATWLSSFSPFDPIEHRRPPKHLI